MKNLNDKQKQKPLSVWKRMPARAMTFLIVGEIFFLGMIFSSEFRAWLNGLLAHIF